MKGNASIEDLTLIRNSQGPISKKSRSKHVLICCHLAAAHGKSVVD